MGVSTSSNVIFFDVLHAQRPTSRELLPCDIPTTASTLPNNAPVGIVVGSAAGLGDDKADITLSTTPQVLTVAFRDVAVVKEGITYESSVLSPTRVVFEAQLEKQSVVVRAKSTAITQSFVA